MTDYKRPNSDNYFEIQAELGLPFLGKELDTELTDAKNQRIALKQEIDATAAGNIPGSNNPINENKVLKTNGAGQVSWVFAGENEIADGGVTTAKYRDQSINTDKYMDLSVSNAKLAANAVTTEKIADASVTYDKLGANTVLEIMKLIYPIGDTKTLYNNNTPPFQNSGMTWILIEDGYAVISTTDENAGATSGDNRLDTGNTDGHALSASELAKHDHGLYTVHNTIPSSNNTRYVVSNYTRINGSLNSTYKTELSGSGNPHKHKLNVKTIKLRIWRRTA